MELERTRDRVVVLRADGDVAREIGGVEALEGEAFPSGVVDSDSSRFSVGVDFGGGIVHVVFVGRETGPAVAAGSVDLDDDEFVSGEVRAVMMSTIWRGSVSHRHGSAANDVFWG